MMTPAPTGAGRQARRTRSQLGATRSPPSATATSSPAPQCELVRAPAPDHAVVAPARRDRVVSEHADDPIAVAAAEQPLAEVAPHAQVGAAARDGDAAPVAARAGAIRRERQVGDHGGLQVVVLARARRCRARARRPWRAASSRGPSGAAHPGSEPEELALGARVDLVGGRVVLGRAGHEAGVADVVAAALGGALLLRPPQPALGDRALAVEGAGRRGCRP